MSTATAAARPSISSPRRGGVRLTRRGRLLVTFLVSLTLLAAVLAGAASVSAGTAEPAGPTTAEVVVQPGQTLWEFASSVSAGKDPRDVVRQIQELNGLSGSGLVPGQALVVPLG